MKPTALTRITSSAALAAALVAGPLAGVAHATVYNVTGEYKTITYGDATPPISYTLDNGGTSAIFSVEPLCNVVDNVPSGLRNGKFKPGVYFTGCSGATLVDEINDSIFGYGFGRLTVNTAPAVTVTADSDSYTYGGTPPTLVPEYTGFVNGDSFSDSGFTAPTCAAYTSGGTQVTLDSTTPGGSYVTRCSGGVVDTALYSEATYTGAIHYVDGTLDVNPAGTITVTAKTASFTYGGTVPNLDPTVSGFINGDSFTDTGFTAPTCSVYSDSALTTPVTASSTMAPGTYYTQCAGAAVDTDLYTDVAYGSAGTLTVDAYATGPGTYTGALVAAAGSKMNLQSIWTLDAACTTTNKFVYEFSTNFFETWLSTSPGGASQQVYTNVIGLNSDTPYEVRGHYLGDDGCDESFTDTVAVIVYALGDSAYGGGWYSYSGGGGLSGRSNFGFAVSKKPGTTNQYRGQLLWTFKNTWRFKASLNNFGKQTASPPKGTLAATGTLYMWNSETAMWDVYATGVNVNVALQATYTPLKKSDPTAYAGSFKISIGTVPTSPAPPLPTMFTASSLLKGGNIKIN